MFVNTKECIGCWLCIQECPVNAIFEDSEVPEEWPPYIERKASNSRDPLFRRAEHVRQLLESTALEGIEIPLNRVHLS